MQLTLSAYYHFFCEGRFPNVEVRKINSTEEKETIRSDTFISTFSQNKDEAPVSGSDTYYEKSGQEPSEISFEVLPTAGESSEEDEGKIPLYLFVYGVRYGLSTLTNEWNEIFFMLRTNAKSLSQI